MTPSYGSGDGGVLRGCYAYPLLGAHDFFLVRLLGGGLGNLLFPFARAVVASREHGLALIAATWPQIKIGTFLRRERDKRFYTGMFTAVPEEVRGFRRIQILALNPRRNEGALGAGDIAPGTVFVFEGLGSYFEALIGRHAEIRAAIHERLRPTHRKALAIDLGGHLCLHVRRGDFKVSGIQTPTAWYEAQLGRLRAELGTDVPAVVFSDGEPHELAPLFGLPCVEWFSTNSAVGDLLALSTGGAILGSARSTFSQWACFLGRVPALWPSAHPRQVLLPDRRGAEAWVADDEPLPRTFVEHVDRQLHSQSKAV